MPVGRPRCDIPRVALGPAGSPARCPPLNHGRGILPDTVGFRMESAPSMPVDVLPARAETRWRATATVASLPEAVRENEEVVPVNVSTWVLPSGVTVGR